MTNIGRNLPMKRLTAVAIFVTAFLLADKAIADVLCFFKGEQVSGMNKICYYDCLGSAAAITIQAFQLCPLNIHR